MEIVELKKLKKNLPKFYCDHCDFKCYMKCDWDRHIARPKHLHRVSGTHLETKLSVKTYSCDCNKKYYTKAGLWKHQQKCLPTDHVNEDPSDKELIMILVKQNTELLEVIKNGTHNTTNNNTTNNTSNNTTNNKTFNLNFFLNETCKDAMNITDFAEAIKLQLNDLIKVGETGYVEGISNIITTNLQALDVTQRPIHCTDKKREVLYIKNDNKWEKENEEKTKVRKLIKTVANKNIKLLPKFAEEHPTCKESDSAFSEQYSQLIIESMGGPGSNDCEKESKIIKNISSQVIVDK